MLPRMGRRTRFGRAIRWALVLFCSPGCLSRQLELTTRRTLSTLPDLNYQQVIDNLAAAASNPGVLPYLAVAGQGSVQVTDNGNSTLGLSVPLRAPALDGLALGASRNVTGTWSLGTITSPEKIRAMQALYQRAVAGARDRDPAYRWLQVGPKHDIPKGALYAARHGEVSVWVMPEEIAGLSELTLAILDVATRQDDAPASSASKASPHRDIVPRRNFQVPASGPVFTPGVG
jgi:hypothetical protein